jgi:hypothetical protein
MAGDQTGIEDGEGMTGSVVMRIDGTALFWMLMASGATASERPARVTASDRPVYPGL